MYCYLCTIVMIPIPLHLGSVRIILWFICTPGLSCLFTHSYWFIRTWNDLVIDCMAALSGFRCHLNKIKTHLPQWPRRLAALIRLHSTIIYIVVLFHNPAHSWKKLCSHNAIPHLNTKPPMYVNCILKA